MQQHQAQLPSGPDAIAIHRLSRSSTLTGALEIQPQALSWWERGKRLEAADFDESPGPVVGPELAKGNGFSTGL
jgi:hypothetical protein